MVITINSLVLIVIFNYKILSRKYLVQLVLNAFTTHGELNNDSAFYKVLNFSIQRMLASERAFSESHARDVTAHASI